MNFAAPKLRGTRLKEANKGAVVGGESGDGAWKSRICWSCWLPRKTTRGSNSCCHGPRHPDSALGSSSILPRLSKTDERNSGMVLPSYRSCIGCCCRYLYNLPVPGLPIQCTTVSQLAARLLFSKYCLNSWARELQGTSVQSEAACDHMLALPKAGGCKLVPVPGPCRHGAWDCTYLHIQEQSRPPYCQHSSDPTCRTCRLVGLA